MSDPSLPRLPERYRVAGLVGRGRDKEVYLATDRLLDRPVAIAVIRPDAGARETVLREARLAARLGDLPHLVTLYDVLETPDGLHLVSRYLGGGTLARALAADGSPGKELREVPALVRLALHLTRALESLHAHGIVHGDVTPGNVLLDERHDAYLSDFGLSTALLPRPGVSGPHEALRAAEFAGTLRYMAPERAWGGAATPQSDIYGLGCVLYEVATGASPFAELSPHRLVQARLELRPRPVRDTNDAIPPPLCDLISAMLAPDPSARPSSCADLRAALEGLARSGLEGTSLAPPVAAAVAIRAPEQLVGREPELRVVREAIARAAAGTSSCLVVEGEAGIGKTRLLQAVAAHVSKRGGTFAMGHARTESPGPFQPFLEALLPLVARLSELPPDETRSLRAFLRLDGPTETPPPSRPGSTETPPPSRPGSTETPPPSRPGPTETPPPSRPGPTDAVDRRSMFVGLLRALSAIARESLLALVVDDVQWADADSVDLLEFLVRATQAARSDAGGGILLVVARRPSVRGGRVASALARLEVEGRLEALRLEPLTEEATFGFLAALGLRPPAGSLVRELHQVTQGNPLFVLEALESLRRRGALDARDGRVATSGPGQIDLPRSLRAAIAERTRTVGQPCRRMLTIASYIGERFELRHLREVAGTESDALLDLLDEAVRADLLVEEIETFRFRHPLVRQAFYRGASLSRRRRIHAQIAARLEDLHASAPERGVAEIAHHLVRAGRVADPEKVLRFAAAAAEQACAACAWGDAADLYVAAIHAAERTGRLSEAACAELHRRAAVAHRFASDAGLSLEQFDEAIAAFDASGDRYGLALALEGKLATQIAMGGLSYGQRPDVEPVERALAELDEAETTLRARLLGTLAVARWAAQESASALAYAEEALALAVAEHDAGLASDLRTQLALAQLQRTQLRPALDTWRAALDDARGLGDAVREEAALQRMPMVFLALGDLRRAAEAVDEAERLNRLVHSPANLSLTLANRTTMAALRADAEQAHRHASACVEVMKRANYGWSAMLALPSLAYAHALRGDDGPAKGAVDRILEPGFVFDDPSIFAESMSRYHHLIDAYAGREIRADVTADLSALGGESDGLDFAFLTPLCVEVEIAWYSNGGRIPSAVGRALAHVHHRGMLFTTAWPLLIPRLRGIAATMEGRWDEAERCFEQATEIADTRDISPERGRCRLDHATMLLARGAPETERRAAELVRESIDRFREAGMVGFERRATALAKSAVAAAS